MSDKSGGSILADVAANEPYIVTHGSISALYDERHQAMAAAIERMETT